jgi:hypothetical protein
VAREIDLLQAGSVEPAAEPLAQPIGPHGRMKARQIDDVDLAPGAQRTEQRRPPSPRASEAVDEHQRFAAARDAVTDRASVDLDFPKLDIRFDGVSHLTHSGRCPHGPPARQLSTRT